MQKIKDFLEKLLDKVNSGNFTRKEYNFLLLMFLRYETLEKFDKLEDNDDWDWISLGLFLKANYIKEEDDEGNEEEQQHIIE